MIFQWRAVVTALLLATGARAETPLERFQAAVAAGQEQQARKVGAAILGADPESDAAFVVVRQHLQSGWKLGKLATSYETLRDWCYERASDDEPDLRLQLLELLGHVHPRGKIVASGGILYSMAWCHWKAERYPEAILLCRRFLDRHPDGSEADKVRFTLAESLLAQDPPQRQEAIRQLEEILKMPAERMHDRARALLDDLRAPALLALDAGAPSRDGLGQTALLTDLAPGDLRLAALADWLAARGARVLRFDRLASEVRGELQRMRPEHVALAVAPETADINFHLDVVELCRNLDADPMPDFDFGYLCARDAADLHALAARLLAATPPAAPVVQIAPITAPGTHLAAPDALLHFGHGQPWRIEDGLTGEEIATLELPRAPTIFSGACFSAVLSRSYHTSQLQYAFQPPQTVAPGRLVSLAWIHAGAAALLAALEGDRGEMAMVEWQYFLETAAPLGEVMAHQYRLVFTNLPASFQGFPRYVPGHTKRMGFFDVMLRGQVSRLLLSDPSYRPLAAPVESPSQRVSTAVSDGVLAVDIEVLRATSGPFINTLPSRGDDFTQSVFARVAVPAAATPDPAAEPEVTATHGDQPIELLSTRLRHEVWGGDRYVVLLVEARSGLAKVGSKVSWRLPLTLEKR